MGKWIFVFLTILSVSNLKANHSDQSSIILIEKSEDRWAAQVRAPLKSFETAVKSEYGRDSYHNQHEFKSFVLDYIRQNLHIHFNDLNNTVLVKGEVDLGDETIVDFELLNTPRVIESLHVKDLGFKEESSNSSVLTIGKRGMAKKVIELNKMNEYEAEMIIGGFDYKLNSASFTTASPSYPMLLVCGLVFFGLSGILYFGGFDTRFRNKNTLDI